MGKVLIIGNGISGLSCALRCMQNGLQVTLASPFPPERAQSVMAAGGINAVLTDDGTEEGVDPAAAENCIKEKVPSSPGFEAGSRERRMKCQDLHSLASSPDFEVGSWQKDSVALHIEDTIKAGAYLGGLHAVTGLCESAEEIIGELKKAGTVFSTDTSGMPARRAFGGQSRRRTCYCGTSTGKQIVTSLSMEVRRYEAAGSLKRMEGFHFYSALIRGGICYGALLLDDRTQELKAVYADAVVMATGGMNALFGKTTGSMLCDGYAAGRLFLQGVELKNLEFIQYHPTTMETAQKRILISEAARGEGGRLFYLREKSQAFDHGMSGATLQTAANTAVACDENSPAAANTAVACKENSQTASETAGACRKNGRGRSSVADRQGSNAKDSDRVYFMEEKYGSGGNLMTRDITSREIDSVGRQVYLDLSFLGKELIDRRLPEIRDLCWKFGAIDVTKEPIPVAPSVHFFMGGIAVHLNHETSVRNLFAVGECASMYHGANRLGGNSLLAAIYSGRVAADAITKRSRIENNPKRNQESGLLDTEQKPGLQGKTRQSGIPENTEDTKNSPQTEDIRRPDQEPCPDFREEIENEQNRLKRRLDTESSFPVMYIRNLLAETMRHSLGIIRDQETLERGIADVDYYQSIANHLRYDSSVSPYENYSLEGILAVAGASLACAMERRESRGAHYRSDYPQMEEKGRYASIVSREGDLYKVRLDTAGEYEN